MADDPTTPRTTGTPAAPEAAEADPFEEFNRAQGQGSVADPHPIFTAMRQQCPVHHIDLTQLVPDGAERPGVPGIPREIYAVMSYEAVSEVLRDGKRFSSQGYADFMGRVMGHTILEMDEPEHTTYRKLIQKAFSPKALARWEHEVVGPVIHRLIDRFAPRGRADLVRELTFPFPVSVIAHMIGLPEEDHAAFHRAAIELISVAFDWDRAVAGSRKLEAIFRRVLDARRAEPGDDLVSVLAQAEVDGTRLSDDEIFAFLRLLAPAGAETTYRSSSNLLFALLTHPEQLEALRADRSLIAAATEEGLRWEAPLVGIMRRTTEPVEVCGVDIPGDAVINVNLASANRDETCFPEPERFDIQRRARTHMAFAFGTHRCLGMHLARMETRVLLDAVLDRLPELRLDPAAENVHVTGMTFRSPLALPVVFEPRPGPEEAA